MATDARHQVCSGLLLAFLLAPLAAAQPWPVCGSSGNDNSSYQANLNQLSAILPTNASGPLFAKAAVGAAPEITYALALCRGDCNATACESCVASAFQDALQLCPDDKDAAIYRDDCSLRFSNESFLGNIDNGKPIVIGSPQNVSSSVEKFDAAVGVLLNATADYAAANSSRRFATGEEASHSRGATIYGLAQCTPDMSPADCRSCLREMITSLRPQYLSGRQGGRIDGVRCNFRYELNNKFFTGASTLRLQTRLWPPQVPAAKNTTATATEIPGGRTVNRKRISLAITLSVGATLLSITVVWLCFLRKRIPTVKQVPSSDTDEDTEFVNSLLLDIATLRAATDNFAESSVIGEGGFGAVYKGVLRDGQEIAVKRLFQISEEGIQELKMLE